MFNKKIYFNPLKNLHWKGFQTTHTLYSLDKFTEQLSILNPTYNEVPFFKKAFEYYEKYQAEELSVLQKQFLDTTNHDQCATLFPAFIAKKEMSWLKHQAQLAFNAAICFARDIAKGRGRAKEFRAFLTEKYPEKIADFDSILETALCNYPQFSSEETCIRYAERANNSAFYSECGIDFMWGKNGWAFAELQFSYQSYPQNLQTLFRGLKKISPELLQGTFESSYPKRRAELLEKYIASTSNSDHASNKSQRIVLDAWTATEHPTRNYKSLANTLGAKYLLFDDFMKNGDGLNYRSLIGEENHVFIFNQPLLYFLDSDSFFESILHERLEEYDHLGLDGLFEDYLSGRVHLANPPVIDLLNDKAIYQLLPYLVEFYLGDSLELNISVPQPVWSYKDPMKCDAESIRLLLEHKDNYVLCHRYLEGGDGIRVGKYLAQDKWGDFIENYVQEKPYLFVMREYFPMNPDISFRIYCSGLFEKNNVTVETSDELLGRINPTGSLAERSYFFLCQQQGL